MKYEEIFVVVNDLQVRDDNDEVIKLKKDTLLSFICNYNKDLENKEWRFYLADGQEDCAQIIIPEVEFKNNVKIYQEYYQEQFNHLDKACSYFGQLHANTSFIMEENGKKVLYGKISEYISKDGVKYNAYRLPTIKDSYWEIDNEKTYKDKEFVYFNSDQKINSPSWNKQFLPPQKAMLCELAIDFPEMLEIVDRLFKKEELTDDLKKIYNTYYERKLDDIESYRELSYVPISNIMSLVQEKMKQIENEKIMAQIERETQEFKTNLIRQRMK